MKLLPKIKYYLILLSIFLVPLIFNPYSTEVFGVSKGVTIIFFSILLLLLTSIESLLSKKLTFKLSWVHGLVLIILCTVLVSIIANIPFVASLLSQGTTTALSDSLFGVGGSLNTSLLIIVFLIIYYFVLTQSLNDEKKREGVLYAITISGVFVILISFLRYILPSLDFGTSPFQIILNGYTNITSFLPDIKNTNSFSPQQNFSTLGEYYYMPLFLLICIIFQIYICRVRSAGHILKYFNYAILAVLVLGFVLSTWDNVFHIAFFILAVCSMGFMLFKRPENNIITKRIVKVGFKFTYHFESVLLLSSLLGIILSITGKFKQITAPILDLDNSWKIAFSSVGNSLKNGFFGLGPETYPIQYLAHKPVTINATNLAFENITHSGNFFLEIISTYGLIGLVGLIYIIGRISFYFYKNIKTHDLYIQSLMAVFGVIGVSLLLLPVNNTIMFMCFVLLALLSAVDLNNKNIRNLFISFKGNPTTSNVFNFSSRTIFEKEKTDKNFKFNKDEDKNLAPILFIFFSSIIFLTSFLFIINLVIDQVYNYKSIRNQAEDSTGNSFSTSLNYSTKSIEHFGNIDSFYNRIASISYSKLLNLITDISNKVSSSSDPNAKPTLTADEQAQIDNLIDLSTKNIDKAIEISPLHFDNYYLKANIYYTFAKIGDTSTVRDKNLLVAETSAKNALELNSQLQNLYFIYAQILLLKGNSIDAITAYQDGINKYPYNIAAYVSLAEVYRETKNYIAALAQLNTAQKLLSPDQDLYKQITTAIDNLTKEQKTSTSNTDITVKPSTTPTPTPSPTPQVTTIIKKK